MPFCICVRGLLCFHLSHYMKVFLALCYDVVVENRNRYVVAIRIIAGSVECKTLKVEAIQIPNGAKYYSVKRLFENSVDCCD